VQQRLGQDQSLLPSERKLFDKIIRTFFQPATLQGQRDCVLLFRPQLERIRKKLQILMHAHSLVHACEIRLIPDHRSHDKRLKRRIRTIDGHCSAIALDQPSENFHECRFSGSVRAN
jgi:hypothetical protein